MRSASAAGSLEAAADRFLDALRNRELVRVLPVPLAVLAIDLSLLDQRLDHFLDEEGVAFRFAVERRGEFRRYRALAEQRGEQRRGVVARQPREGDPRHQALAIPVDEDACERMRAIELQLAIGAEDQDTIVAQVAQQVVEERERSLIGPVEIVDEDQQPVMRGERLQEACDVVEEPQSLLAR